VQLDADALGVVDDVAVGEDVGAVAAGGKNEAGTLADGAARLCRRRARQPGKVIAEETPQQVVLQRPVSCFTVCGLCGAAFDVDEHHRWRYLARHTGERLAGLAQALDAAVLRGEDRRQEEQGKAGGNQEKLLHALRSGSAQL